MIGRIMPPDEIPRPVGHKGHVLLEAVWDHFAKTQTWPPFDDIDRELYRQEILWEDAVQELSPGLLRGLDPDVSHLPQGTQPLSLTVAGAINCKGSEVVLKVFLRLLELAVDIDRAWRPSTPGDQPQLRSTDMTTAVGTDPQGMTDKAAYAAALLAIEEPCFRGGGYNFSDLTWSLNMGRDIRGFAGVASVLDYWKARERMLGSERAESDRRNYFKGRREDALQATLFGTATTVPVPPLGPVAMEITCLLHPRVAVVAADRFADSYYRDAVRAAIQAVEHRVQELTGIDKVGEPLMGIAFGKPGPMIKVTRSTGASLESEQTGMQFLFKGAIGALRNPRSHGPDEKDQRDEAQEILVFASLLMRRLDIEDEERAKAQPAGS